MEKFTSILLAELSIDLQKIAVTSENKLQQAERSFKIADQAILRLKEFIATYTFKSPEEEIRFFKEIKPEFQKELFYNEEVLYIESNCPKGPNKARKVFIERTLNRIQAYFEKHSYIYNYCLSGDTSLDTFFFVRSPKPIPLTPVSYSDIDPEFSNPHSYKVAKLKAFEELRDYLSNKEQSNTTLESFQNKDNKQKLVFTGPPAALEEALLAMNEKGWFNFGDLPASRLFHAFESLLDIKLANPSRALIGMAIRKKGYTPHIDKMKDALIERIEQKHQ
ncbi:RteC domain-containing protein [Sphingobacterium siyangense]|uniref:RteC domain-containing protein n=1 Tax=Sphingobacterium siyangense TaxID=459529 RepID=UPI002FDCE32B